jgi:hypothetical protein
VFDERGLLDAQAMGKAEQSASCARTTATSARRHAPNIRGAFKTALKFDEIQIFRISGA